MYIIKFLDICNFLYDERMMMMTEKDRKMAESIVTRSREQMKALSRLKPLIQSNEEYVTMNKGRAYVKNSLEIFS